MSKQTAFTRYLNDVLKGRVKEMSYYLELEKQNIINAHIRGNESYLNPFTYITDAENYYKETYEKEEKHYNMTYKNNKS